MNNGYDYFNLYSARNNNKHKLSPYIITDYNNQQLSISINNNKRSNSHKTNTINSYIFDEDNLIIKPYGQKNRENYIFNYDQNDNNSNLHKNNLIQFNSSSSNLNTIQNNSELKQRDLLINKLNKELYQKNHQLYKQNNLISDLKRKILKVNSKSEITNKSNNIDPKTKKEQINNTIYNLKKGTINKEFTTKLKENGNFYKKIMNENLDSFNYKLIELENKNIILLKKNHLLKNEVMDIKNKYNSIKNKKFISIKPIHEINLYIIKRNNFVKIDKNNKDENYLKMQKLISQYKLKIFNLNNEIKIIKSDLQIKNNQIINIKNQYNTKQNKYNEILNDNKIKEKKILLKEKERESKIKEINNLNNKIDQLLNSFEKEKKEKEQILKLYEKYNNKNEIEKNKSSSLSKDSKLKNISSQSHKIILNKNITKYKLSWFLITIKNENEIKNYLNTFWISEEEMEQIKSKLCLDSSYMNLDEDIEMNIKEIDKNNEVIKNLNNIIEEKEKIIFELKNKIKENENSINLLNNENNKDEKGFISMDKYIKIVNQLNEAKMKIKELSLDNKNNKNDNLNINKVNQEINNINFSGISEDFSDFMKNDVNGNNINIINGNKNNRNNLNNSDDTNKYLEKYIDDLENKLENIKNLIKLLIKEMRYTNNIKNTLYNLMIVSGFNDQEAISMIQDKQKSSQKDNYL